MKTKQLGFTLIEILISLVLGLIVVGGTLSIYISSIRSSIDISNSAQLNYDLDSTMQLMVNDIKRAGHWGGAIANSDATNNIFMSTTLNMNIQLRNFAAPTTAVDPANCILYTYDADGDGNVDGNNDGDLDDVGDDKNEFYGFRLNGNTVQMRLAGESTNDCDDEDNDTWSAITDNTKINITRLTFSLSATTAVAGPPSIPALPTSTQCLNVTTNTPYTMSCATAATTDTDGDGTNNLIAGDTATEVRQINIILTGQSVDDASVTKVSTATIKIRNDRVLTQ